MATDKEKKGLAAGAGILGVLGIAFLKFQGVIWGALKALPLLKLGWLLKGSWTMIVSFGLYAMVYGWKWAVAFIVLIYIHEMGHFIFMKAKGLNPSAPVFVPFLGAYVAMKNLPEDPVTHAWVAYAGPLVGGLGALGFYWLGEQTGQPFLIAAASTGFILNLLQLVPVKPFDGGFIAEAISKWLMIPGVIMLGAMALIWQSPIMIILAVIAVFITISNFRGISRYEGMEVPAWERAQVTVAYFGLAWALGYYYWHTHSIAMAAAGK